MKQAYRILLTLLLLMAVTTQRADDTTFTAANLTCLYVANHKLHIPIRQASPAVT